MSEITLEQALKLFELPRNLGEYEGTEVAASSGRFGPYIKFGKLFVSIPKDISPASITLEEAIALIDKKREAEANKLIKNFEEIPGLQALNGRFGPYLAYKPEGAKKVVNYKLAKTIDPRTLTAEEAREIMQKQDAAPKKPARRRKS